MKPTTTDGLPQGDAGDASQQTCSETAVSISRAPLEVMFVIDGSGSMCEAFDDSSRWEALRGALLDPSEGVIYRYEGTVEIGVHIYDGGTDPDLAALAPPVPPEPACTPQTPRLGTCDDFRLSVAPALNNATAIDRSYFPFPLGGSTPTDLAMREVWDQLTASMSRAERGRRPRAHVIVLVTDGVPNSICEGGRGSDSLAENEVVSVVEQAAEQGIRTYVIGMAEDATLQTHLDAVAAAGATSLAPFVPTTREEIIEAVTQIFHTAPHCELVLNGTVNFGSACLGALLLNGVALPCGERDGWEPVDERTLLLRGKACEDFLADPNADVQASFPCHTFTAD